MTLRPLATALTIALACTLPAFGESADRLDIVLKRGTLRVGTTMDTPVFSMRKDGQLEGFDMDALQSLGAALGVRIEYVRMTFGTMLADLAADKFDIAMSGMGRTLDRARVGAHRRQAGRRHHRSRPSPDPRPLHARAGCEAGGLARSTPSW